MPTMKVQFQCFPATLPTPDIVSAVVSVFARHEARISTPKLDKGLSSDQVLAVVRDDLIHLGFDVEAGKRADEKIHRPVFFGRNGVPSLKYEIDGYHEAQRCGLEIEAGRAWMGNAVYRDLIQAMVMVQVELLVLAVPLSYKYKSGGKTMSSSDFENTVALASALYGHARMPIPYHLAVIGY